MRTHEANNTAIYHNKAGIVMPTVRHTSKTSNCLVGKVRDCADAGVRRCRRVYMTRLIWEDTD